MDETSPAVSTAGPEEPGSDLRPSPPRSSADQVPGVAPRREQRAIFVMSQIEGISTEEIARSWRSRTRRVLFQPSLQARRSLQEGLRRFYPDTSGRRRASRERGGLMTAATSDARGRAKRRTDRPLEPAEVLHLASCDACRAAASPGRSCSDVLGAGDGVEAGGVLDGWTRVLAGSGRPIAKPPRPGRLAPCSVRARSIPLARPRSPPRVVLVRDRALENGSAPPLARMRTAPPPPANEAQGRAPRSTRTVRGLGPRAGSPEAAAGKRPARGPARLQARTRLRLQPWRRGSIGKRPRVAAAGRSPRRSWTPPSGAGRRVTSPTARSLVERHRSVRRRDDCRPRESTFNRARPIIRPSRPPAFRSTGTDARRACAAAWRPTPARRTATARVASAPRLVPAPRRATGTAAALRVQRPALHQVPGSNDVARLVMIC
jgi:hypothetical protein